MDESLNLRQKVSEVDEEILWREGLQYPSLFAG